MNRDRPSLLATFGFAFSGLLRALLTERNMKIHWVCGLAVLMVGMALPLPLGARTALLFALVLVLALETLNCALEAVVDLAGPDWSVAARTAKDAAAGAVLVVALGAAFLLADVLAHRWPLVEASGVAVRRTLTFGLPSLAGLAASLALPRGAGSGLALGVAAVALAPLVLASQDAVFSLLACLLLAAAGAARALEPRLLSGDPPGPRG